jgi:hypothetical protein
LVVCETFIPETLEQGKLYYSKEYQTTVHLCLCGCGQETACPIGLDEWQLKIETNGKPTMTPSLQHTFACRSHYIITKGIANFV